jgi:hypothetical protein
MITVEGFRMIVEFQLSPHSAEARVVHAGVVPPWVQELWSIAFRVPNRVRVFQRY